MLKIAPAALIASLGLSSGAGAQIIWQNVPDFPNSLATTGDAWSAVRIEDPQFISYRVAADDFVLTEKTHITRITFFSVPLGSPDVVGGDWYIFQGPAQGPPTTLVAAGPASAMLQQPIGVNNPNFGDVLSNTMEPTGLVLDPGHYFLAFRTYQNYTPGGKNTNGALSTRTAKATSRAWWNFGLLPNGSVTESWVSMQVFNLVEDQEWAFQLEGEAVGCYADCDGSGTLNIFDYICFGNAYGSQQAYADCDGNGAFNIFDYICFGNAYGAGCP